MKFFIDKNIYKFKEIIEEIFNTKDLENYHKKVTEKLDKYIYTRENDNTSIYHKIFYGSDKLDIFIKEYIKLIKEIHNTRYKDEKFIVYQKIPALRVSYPGNKSVGELHNDFQYNHPSEEMNYWFPITETNEKNTCWHETEENKGDYKPLLLNYGEVAEVYFNKLRHYSPINKSDKTRISFDFRIIPGSKWNNIDKKESSMFHKVKFDIGNYYEKNEKNILLELRICTNIKNTKLYKRNQLSPEDTRLKQYITGLKKVFEYKAILDKHNVQVYLTDNTTTDIDKRILDVLPDNVKVVTCVNNRFGSKNKGAGDIEQWTYCKDLIKEYEWFIHFEPRQLLQNFNFITNFLNNPRNLFTMNRNSSRFNTGLFCIKSKLLLGYIKHTPPPKLKGNIEDDLYHYVKNNDSFDLLDKMELIWFDCFSKKEYFW